MLTLYHANQSRSTRILQLLDELGAKDHVTVTLVSVPRHDGSGTCDPANPHAEGKVPLLIHDGVAIRESTAITLYLTDMFPDAGFAPHVGDANRGAYLAWLAWYSGVLEPVFVMHVLGIQHPGLPSTFRTMREAADVLETALRDGPFLMGDQFSAADLICASAFSWMPDTTPDVPAIKEWVARCMAQPSAKRALDTENRLAA